MKYKVKKFKRIFVWVQIFKTSCVLCLEHGQIVKKKMDFIFNESVVMSFYQKSTCDMVLKNVLFYDYIIQIRKCD